MTAKQALLERLRRDAPGVETVEAHLEQQKQEWLRDLEALMNQLAGWLAEGEAEELLKIERTRVELAEQDLGPYEAPGLTIQVRTKHPRVVKVHPRGMRIFGVVAASDRRIVNARGRVDITSGAARTTLLRRRSNGVTSWQIVHPVGTTEALTEESFSSVMGEILE